MLKVVKFILVLLLQQPHSNTVQLVMHCTHKPSEILLMVHVYESGEEMNIVVFCRLLVGAPWSGFSQNRKGDVYKCPVSGSRNSCDKLNLQGKVFLFNL